MKEKTRQFLFILGISLLPTFLIWIPFLLRITSFWHVRLPQNGFASIVSNYDGPLYLVVAKTMYNKGQIESNFQFPLSSEYYAAHFPFYPALIRTFSIVINYPYAMILVTLLSSLLAIYFFNKLASLYANKKDALFLTFIFSIFPARWLIVRSVGSADPLFVAGIIASIFYFKEKKFWAAGLWGVVAQLTKSPGILLFASYFIFLLLPLIKYKPILSKSKMLEMFNIKRTFPLLLIPLSLLAVFTFYWFVQGDFLAYFHSGNNIHLAFPPFQIFDYTAPWVGTSWLEEVVFIFLIGAMGVVKLLDKKDFEIGIFTGIFFLSTLFVTHRDLLRYSLPIVPFLLIAYHETLIKKEFKYALIVILVPIYLFSLAFISQNIMPISNWAPFL